MKRLPKERNGSTLHITLDSIMIYTWSGASMIKDLEKRKDKAMKRSDTDDFWIKIESLQWVLFVIFAIRNEKMVVI
jgi:DNA replication initiation complex subunit (GINS family)